MPIIIFKFTQLAHTYIITPTPLSEFVDRHRHRMLNRKHPICTNMRTAYPKIRLFV